MKDAIQHLLLDALLALHNDGALSETPDIDTIEVSRTRDAAHGDFASNIAMKSARLAKTNPRELARRIVDALPANDLIEKTEIAGPGFINFFVKAAATQSVIMRIIEQGERYGASTVGEGQSVQVEFVSANPTGPLHVGHGRGAAYGAVVANLLDTLGFKVHREYYVNDAGRQMHILAVSVWLRYLELAGETLPFPSNGYQGDYIWDIGATLHREHGDAYRHPAETVFADIPADAPEGDKEVHIDALIERARDLLGEEKYRDVFDLALNTLVDNIRNDLAQFGVHYDEWFSERSLMDSGAAEACIDQLRAAGHLYEQDGALWFRSTAFGDEKDRVVRRKNGQPTYFASDIAYHVNKLERGFDKMIDIWGADHHGYVPRVRAALQAMGQDPETLDILLIQFAVLYEGGQKLAMSTRSGEFVTLRELRERVGTDAARFFYVMRRHDQHLDFDLDLATSKTSENPVYYVQYAHARICSVLRQAEERGVQPGEADLSRLVERHETDLITHLAKYPEQVEKAGLNREPHRIAQYLRELAHLFHGYYNAHQFLVDDQTLRDARLKLCDASRVVLRNGLALLDVSAPETM